MQLSALLLQLWIEIIRMALDDLDLKADTWVIPPDRMKAGQAHQVAPPSRAVALIREAIHLAKVDDQEPVVVFPNPRQRSSSVPPDNLTQAMDRIRTAVGVTGATTHDLRRTGSSALTSELTGIGPFIRSKVLGHGTDAAGGASVSLTHYDVDGYLPEKRRTLEAWEGLLLEIVGEKVRPTNVSSLHAA